MTTNSKPELCEVCGGKREKPLYRDARYPRAMHGMWHVFHDKYCDVRHCIVCPDPFHTQAEPADKHKRVAERQFQKLEDMICQPMEKLSPEVLIALADILREEYPE